MDELNNILSNSDEHNQLPEEQLMAYLEGRLTPAEQHEVELWLSNEGMESDAMEGLRSLQPSEMRLSVNRLNHRLRKATANRKKKRRPATHNQFTWIAILIILLLVIVAYIVLRKAM